MFASDSQTTAKQFRFLVEATAWRYRSAGLLVYGLVLAELRHDPIYRELLRREIVPPEGLVLHLGCGRGILLALLATARTLDMTPGGSGAARPRLCGFESSVTDAEFARAALGSEAEIVVGDWGGEDLPACRIAILLDVLLYLGKEEQDTLLTRMAAALEPGGILIIREADAAAGWRFATTKLAERLRALSRGDWRQPCGFRGATEWQEKLASLGFAMETQNLGGGTPLAQVLLIGRRVVL